MSGDYSRERFDPNNDFHGVLMQQGRVQLDADWNELIRILDRRLRAETTDIIGEGVVPKETPAGFQIQIASGGGVTIGRGRIYVDGLLAENHGKAPLEFDPVLAEQRGTLPIPYNEQSYLPNASAIAPAPQEGGPHLVYIDVWQREVTYLENPDLIEKAVGVDTTTRLQTVWQIKVLPDVGIGATCDTPVQAWTDLTAPSAGRLSTAAVGVPAATDPCLIPPSGGYRGLENRLYRVEIHDGGPNGTATFKWSRDATVATSVAGITSSRDTLTVARLGRDSVMRFNVGDWIEVTDDWLEFARQPGISPQPPGVMAQIKNVDEATEIITLTNPLPANLFPTDPQGNTDLLRHTRIHRWDQRGQVRDTNGNLLVDLTVIGSQGVIPVPPKGTSIILEDGVQITFDTPDGGNYHVADYWTFAARTADASVESLRQAPPRGIHHHFCRLAMVTFPSTVTDCRDLWPPEFGDAGCDCSVCVTADSHNRGTLTIQHAIDQLKAIGGTVCLGVGTYNLTESPISISGTQSIRVRGQGFNTNLLHTGQGSAVVIVDSTGVMVEELTITTRNANNTEPVIALSNSGYVTLQRNRIEGIVSNKGDNPAIGLAGTLIGTVIRENILLAPTGIGNIPTKTAAGAPATVGVAPKAVFSVNEPVPLLTASLHIQDNALFCTWRGISLTGVSVHTLEMRLTGNSIQNCPQGGIVVSGFLAPGSGVDVHGNNIKASGSGIEIGTDGARITNNNISPIKPGAGGDGIVLAVGLDRSGLDQCQVLGNRIVGVAGQGISILGVVNSAMIKNNIIEAVGGGGITMAETSRGGHLTIENNQLINIAPEANDPTSHVTGIHVINTSWAEIVGNVIQGLGVAAAQNPIRAGIQAINIGSARIDGNQMSDIGPQTEFLHDTAAIDCLGTFERVDVTNNTIRRGLVPPKTPDASRWFAVRINTLPSTGLTVVKPNLAFAVSRAFIYPLIGNNLAASPRGKEIIGMQGNLVEAYGAVPAVSVVASGALTLTTNRCLLGTVAEQSVVHAQAGAVIADSNYLAGRAKIPALTLQLLNTGPSTILGNITSGVIMINGVALGVPWAPLNVLAF